MVKRFNDIQNKVRTNSRGGTAADHRNYRRIDKFLKLHNKSKTKTNKLHVDELLKKGHERLTTKFGRLSARPENSVLLSALGQQASLIPALSTNVLINNVAPNSAVNLLTILSGVMLAK